MANQDRARGCWPLYNLTGGKIPVHAYHKKGTTTGVYEGGIVVLRTADRRIGSLQTTTGSDEIVGVAANYVAAASSGKTVWVYDSPFTVFGINSDGTTNEDYKDLVGTVATGNAALSTADSAAGNTTTGLSKVELDRSACTSTGTATDNIFKIIGVVDEPSNNSASSHADLEVLLIRHFYNNRSASV